MSYEDLIIHEENTNGPKFALIVDDHKKHIWSHLRYAYRPKILLHILNHVRLMISAKRNNIPHIRLEEVIRRENGKI